MEVMSSGIAELWTSLQGMLKSVGQYNSKVMAVVSDADLWIMLCT